MVCLWRPDGLTTGRTDRRTADGRTNGLLDVQRQVAGGLKKKMGNDYRALYRTDLQVPPICPSLI